MLDKVSGINSIFKDYFSFEKRSSKNKIFYQFCLIPNEY